MLVSQQYVRQPSVLFDSAAGGNAGAGTSWSWGHVVGAYRVPVSSLLLVGIHSNGSTAPNSVKCGGVTMNLVVSYAYTSSFFCTIYGLYNPPTGSQTIAVTSASSDFFAGSSVSYTHVDQTASLTAHAWDVANTSGTTLTGLSSWTGAPPGSVTFIVLGSSAGSGSISGFQGVTYSGNTRFSVAESSFVNYASLIGDITAQEGQPEWVWPGSGLMGAAGVIIYANR